MFERFVERRAEKALSDTPVVLIVGPRRAGKTTLVRQMGEYCDCAALVHQFAEADH